MQKQRKEKCREAPDPRITLDELENCVRDGSSREKPTQMQHCLDPTFEIVTTHEVRHGLSLYRCAIPIDMNVARIVHA